MTERVELKQCPVCKRTPTTRHGVCTNEIEITHKCLMGYVVNRGDFGDVWKTMSRVHKEWNKLCRKAEQVLREFTK